MLSEDVKEWIKDIVIAVIIGLLIIQFIKPTIVKEHSMLPTLNEYDYIFLSKQSYHLFGQPEVGDIIVFHSDLTTVDGKEKMLIKRIIGLPGDVISIADGVVYRNGQPMVEDYTNEGYTATTMADVKVPEDSLFVMGDNRQHSVDSRDPDVGCVEMDRVVGKAVFRLYPFNNMGPL